MARGVASKISQCDIQFRVRYAECDPMGVLHHAKYWEHLETGRTELLRLNGFTYRDMEAGGEFFVVARAECKYLKPIHYDDLVILTTQIDRATRAKIDHAYEMKVGGRLCFIAHSTLACVNAQGQLIPLPERFFID